MITSKGEYTNYAPLAIWWFGHVTPGLFGLSKVSKKESGFWGSEGVKMNITHQNKICHPLDKCDDSMFWLKDNQTFLLHFQRDWSKWNQKRDQKWVELEKYFFSEHLPQCGKNREISLCRYIFGRGLWKHGSCDCCGRVSLFALGVGVARWRTCHNWENFIHQNSLVCLFWICQLKKIMETNKGFWGWNFFCLFSGSSLTWIFLLNPTLTGSTCFSFQYWFICLGCVKCCGFSDHSSSPTKGEKTDSNLRVAGAQCELMLGEKATIFCFGCETMGNTEWWWLGALELMHDQE